MKEKIRMIVRKIVSLLVKGDIEGLARLTNGVRMSEADIKAAIQDYGKVLCMPPAAAFDSMDIVTVNVTATPQFSVRMPLWTKEEGRSDLTLELTIKLPNEGTEVELDDIHVL